MRAGGVVLTAPLHRLSAPLKTSAIYITWQVCTLAWVSMCSRVVSHKHGFSSSVVAAFCLSKYLAYKTVHYVLMDEVVYSLTILE